MAPIRSPREALARLKNLGMEVEALRQSQKQQTKVSTTHARELKLLRSEVNQLLGQVEHLVSALAAETHARELVKSEVERNAASKASVARLEQAVRRLEHPVSEVPNGVVAVSTEPDDEAMPPRLYLAMEDELRGDPVDISQRQRPYVERFAELLPSGARIADLGCGRGEFVQALSAAGLTPIAVDTNTDAIEEIRQSGIEAINQRADRFLREQPDDSLHGISAFHLIEHIPTDAMVRLFEESFRALRSGGVFVLETPNPENIRVGAHTFWLDPTHLKPVPPLLIDTLLRASGFEIVDSLRLSAYPDFERLLAEHSGSELWEQAVRSLYGPQDFGIVAAKPRQ